MEKQLNKRNKNAHIYYAFWRDWRVGCSVQIEYAIVAKGSKSGRDDFRLFS